MISLHKFPHIKGTKSQIISHLKYTNSKSPQVCIPNTKIGLSTQNGCSFKKSKKYTILKKLSIQKKKHVNQNMLIHIGKKFKMFQ